MREKVTRGSGNIFLDLGFEPKEAEELQWKAELVSMLRKIVSARNLTQIAAAEICETDQPTLSKVFRGRLDLVSVDRLFSWFMRLGCVVKITIDSEEVLLNSAAA